MFSKRTIRDIDLGGKTVLLRADYNVPLDGGVITDDYRLAQSVSTIQFLLERNVKLVIISHLGRPKGPHDTASSLEPVAVQLQKLLGRDVRFVPSCVGPEAETAVAELQHGEIALLENLRFHPEEEQNNPDFAAQLARLGDVFVQDGFGVVHRAHASTDGVARLLPSVAGLLLEKEVSTISTAMQHPARPLMAVVGGAKIADKIDILHRFIDVADFVAIGGAMANTFLAAQNIPVAASLVDRDEIGVAKDILHKAREASQTRKFIFYIPQDGVVAKKIDKSAPTRIVDWSAHIIADIESYPKRPPASSSHVSDHEMILDIGPFTGAFIAGAMQQAETVIWNGAMGVTETAGLQGPVGPFAHGTDLIMEAMLGQFGHRPYSIVGGGDTVGYIQHRGLVEAFDHVSTGGGASLELMAGRSLPGVEVLLDKEGGS